MELEYLNLTYCQWLFLVPLKGGRDYITPQKAIYKWYLLPIGGLYNPYHLSGEPETAIDTGMSCCYLGSKDYFTPYK